jgi:glycosyltransferase involved in cell wall biosynthesis
MEYVSELLVERPIISVYIFAYNQQNLISQTIESVLAQKVGVPFEIILVDDDSKDNTLYICLDYYRKHPELIRVIANDENKGFIRNYHETIRDYGRGEYIACIAGDDWWDNPNKLALQLSVLTTGKYDLVHTKCKVYIQKLSIYHLNSMGRGTHSFQEMIISNCIAALTACFTRDCFLEYIQEVDPIKQDFIEEDYPMWIWFSYKKRIYFLNKFTSVYRLQEETLSQSKNPEKKMKIAWDNVRIKKFYIDFFKIEDEGITEKIYLKFYIDTLNLASLINKEEIISQRRDFFLKNRLYFFLFLSRIYNLIGKNAVFNNFIYQLERGFRFLGITKKYYY